MKKQKIKRQFNKMMGSPLVELDEIIKDLKMMKLKPKKDNIYYEIHNNLLNYIVQHFEQRGN